MKSLPVILCVALCGCGGLVVFQEGESEGGGGSSSSTPPPVAGGVSTGPVPAGCTAHIDCPPNQLCIFQTGECTDSCEFESCDACGPGRTCNDCATSACPDCLDCRSACVPESPNQCDDDDPCDPGFVCDFLNGVCIAACDINGNCAGQNMTCEFCVTGSCCGCDDCVAGCVSPL